MTRPMVLLSNLDLTNHHGALLQIGRLSDGNGKSAFAWIRLMVKQYRSADCVLVSNADAPHAAAAMLAKLAGSRVKVVFWDTNLKKPANSSERGKTVAKRLLFKFVDAFIVMHRDTSAYTRYFGIPPRKFRYVAFKANNYEFLDKVHVRDDGYVFSGGASHRDFATVIRAAPSIAAPIRIVLPSPAVAAFNNTPDVPSDLPGNVTVVRHDGRSATWNDEIAGARVVLVAISPDCIQPAGISVYLEAMALGKAVALSRGPSTEGLVDESCACLFERGNATELAAQVNRLLHSPDLRTAIGENARRYALSLEGAARMSRELQRHALEIAGFTGPSLGSPVRGPGACA